MLRARFWWAILPLIAAAPVLAAEGMCGGMATPAPAELPARAWEFRDTADRAIVAQIESARLAYRSQYRKWPATIGVLARYAKDSRRPLNLASHSNVVSRPHSAQPVYAECETKRPELERGGFAVSVFEIEPRRR